MRRAFQLSRTLPDALLRRFEHDTAGLPRTTEAERLVVQRVGQDVFRQGLLEYWDGRCAVTGLGVVELLRASHIKPWAACASDAERLGVFNGLLLAPHLDAVFDQGFISVSAARSARHHLLHEPAGHTLDCLCCPGRCRCDPWSVSSRPQYPGPQSRSATSSFLIKPKSTRGVWARIEMDHQSIRFICAGKPRYGNWVEPGEEIFVSWGEWIKRTAKELSTGSDAR